MWYLAQVGQVGNKMAVKWVLTQTRIATLEKFHKFFITGAIVIKQL